MGRASSCAMCLLYISGTGVFLTLFAFPLCCIIVVSQTSAYRKTVMSLDKDLLLHPPYSPYLGVTTQMAYIGGLTTVIWNYGYVVWFITLSCIWDSDKKSFLIALLVIGEFAQTGMYLALSVLTRDYLPKPLGSCKNYATWKYSPKYPTLFHVLAKEDKTKGEDALFFCRLLVKNWRFQVTLATFGLARVIVLIALGIFLAREMVILDTWHVRPPIRFASRWISKRRGHNSEESKIGKYKLEFKNTERLPSTSTTADIEMGIPNSTTAERSATFAPNSKQHLGPTARPSLHTILSTPAFFTLIAQNLHHADVLSLCLVSRLTRCVITKHTKGTPAPLLPLPLLTCTKGSKSPCYTCGTQICSGCSYASSLPETTISPHFHRCKPYCTSCFYKLFCRKDSRAYKSSTYSSRWRQDNRIKKPTDPTWVLPPTCSCARLDASKPSVERMLCRGCKNKTITENLECRERREKVELKHLEVQELSCANEWCKKRIGPGARWWGCNECSGECAEGVHLSWVGVKR